MADNTFHQLFEQSKAVTPGGVHSPVRAFAGLDTPPLFFKQAQGKFLIDEEDRQYLDLCSSFGPMLLGHRDPCVEKEVSGIIKKAWSFGAPEKYSLDLATWITSKIPFVEKIRFVSSGTEAVMSALRLAKGATGRSLVIKFNGCYHGHVDSMLVKSGSGLAGLGESSSAGVSQSIAAETIVAELGDIEQVKAIFAKYPQEIAAIIIEPLPANYGLIAQSREFLQFLREITQEHDSLLIFDEVISGFRVALGGMAQVTGITPDLVTYGKIIGGGFPVGAFAGKAHIMDQMAPTGPVYQAGTLSANPVSMVAGLATLKKIESSEAIAKANHTCQVFARTLNDLFKANDLNYFCHQESSLFFITAAELNPLTSPAQYNEKHSQKFISVYNKLIAQGVYIAPAAYEVGFFSSIISEQEAKDLAAKFLAAYE